MNTWLRLTTFLIIIGFCKAGQIIRLIILASLGLVGLWMVHTLAQDFSSIYNNFQKPSSGGSGKFFFKRSVYQNDYYIQQSTTPAPSPPQILYVDWERILSNDILGCTQSFICQLIATNSKELIQEEENILLLVRSSSFSKNWTSSKLYEAVKFGEKVTEPSQCQNKYQFCPFSSKAMTSILRLLGKT